MNQQPPISPYIPEKPNHLHTALRQLIYLLIFHAASLVLYFMVLGTSNPYRMSSDAASRIPTTIFIYSLVALFVLGDILVGVYFANSKRKRAYLDATSIEKRGKENIAEGFARYRKLALTEALVCTLTTAAFWLIPTLVYTVRFATSGIGYAYTDASVIEQFFVGFIGLCEPFHNAWIGWLIGTGFMFVFYYFGRILSHNRWKAERIHH